jgi:hypothetical protein
MRSKVVLKSHKESLSSKIKSFDSFKPGTHVLSFIILTKRLLDTDQQLRIASKINASIWTNLDTPPPVLSSLVRSQRHSRCILQCSQIRYYHKYQTNFLNSMVSISFKPNSKNIKLLLIILELSKLNGSFQVWANFVVSSPEWLWFWVSALLNHLPYLIILSKNNIMAAA